MELQIEKNKLVKAVGQFANEMIARLHEMAERGKTGWDGEYPIKELELELGEDAVELKGENPIKAVDIANRAMMLWWRKWGRE